MAFGDVSESFLYSRGMGKLNLNIVSLRDLCVHTLKTKSCDCLMTVFTRVGYLFKVVQLWP